MNDSVMIVAAEASSALYAQRLMEEWQARGKKLSTFGVGNQAMIDLGFEAIGRAESMAVVGFKEVLKHYSEISSVFHQLISECKRRKPKFILLLDYPDFNLRLAKKLKPLGIPIVYYISPQIWAWRKGRIHQMKKFINKVLVLLPFEEDFYKQQGMDVKFVGHPLLDEIEAFRHSEWNRDLARSRIGVSKEDFLLGLMPGSRKSEIAFHLQTQIAVAEKLAAKYPALKVCLLVAKSIDLQSLKDQLPPLTMSLQLMQESPVKMIEMCDFIVAKSGTGTLLLSLLQKPNVIMYKMSSMSAWIARNFVKGVKYFGLANLVLDRAVVTEFFQEQATAENISEAVSDYIDHPDKMQQLKSELQEVQNRLGQKGATKRVADELEAYL